MTFPAAGATSSGTATSTGSVASITLPATVPANALLILVMGTTGPATSLTPATTYGAWTEKAAFESTGSANGTNSIQVKVATGSEAGQSLNITCGSGDPDVTYGCVVVTGWYEDLAGVEISTPTEYDTNEDNYNPQNVTASWGSDDNAFFFLGAMRRPPYITTYPTLA